MLLSGYSDNKAERVQRAIIVTEPPAGSEGEACRGVANEYAP